MEVKTAKEKKNEENNSPVERKSPLGWNTVMDSNDETINVKFIYWAHHKIDDDRPVRESEMRFSFPKQEIIAMIPDEGYGNPFSLVNHAKRLDDRRWAIIQHIKRALSSDFAEIQSRTRSTSDMYAELLSRFATRTKYQEPLRGLAKLEAIIWLLKKPKSFFGGDVRERL